MITDCDGLVSQLPIHFEDLYGQKLIGKTIEYITGIQKERLIPILGSPVGASLNFRRRALKWSPA